MSKKTGSVVENDGEDNTNPFEETKEETVADANGNVTVGVDLSKESEGLPGGVSASQFQKQVNEVIDREKVLRNFIHNHMVMGEDYGNIPNVSKAMLFKPGAEKLNAVFKVAPLIEVTNRIEDFVSGIFAYEVKVTLIHTETGNIMGEGIGNCNSKERKYAKQDGANICNTILKMALKRAAVSASLSNSLASGLFTQDMEDFQGDSDNSDRPAPNRNNGFVNGNNNSTPRIDGRPLF